MASSLEWLTDWYRKQCNGEWELDHFIRISSTDHPGWQLQVDLDDTPYENIFVLRELVEKSEKDWYTWNVHDRVFAAAGDITKLDFLIGLFRKTIESES